MNRIKKIISVFAMTLLVIGVCGCGSKSPKEVTKNYLDEVKTGESKEISTLLNENLNKEKKGLDAKITEKLAGSMKKITYTINSENIEGDTAKVNVKVKGPDVANLVSESMKKCVSMAFSQSLSGKKIGEEEANKMYEKIFLEALENIKYTERAGDIELNKKDGKWEINKNSSLTKLIINIDDKSFK